MIEIDGESEYRAKVKLVMKVAVRMVMRFGGKDGEDGGDKVE